MAGNERGQEKLKQAKFELLNHILFLADEGDSVWNRLVSEQQACANLVFQVYQWLLNNNTAEQQDFCFDFECEDVKINCLIFSK